MSDTENKVSWKNYVAEYVCKEKLKCIRDEEFENENSQESTSQSNSHSSRNNGPVCGQLRSETKVLIYFSCDLFCYYIFSVCRMRIRPTGYRWKTLWFIIERCWRKGTAQCYYMLLWWNRLFYDE